MTYLKIVDGKKGKSQVVVSSGIEMILSQSEMLEKTGQGKVWGKPGSLLYGKTVPKGLGVIA